jgi:hypothetical protein
MMREVGEVMLSSPTRNKRGKAITSKDGRKEAVVQAQGGMLVRNRIPQTPQVAAMSARGVVQLLVHSLTPRRSMVVLSQNGDQGQEMAIGMAPGGGMLLDRNGTVKRSTQIQTVQEAVRWNQDGEPEIS